MAGAHISGRMCMKEVFQGKGSQSSLACPAGWLPSMASQLARVGYKLCGALGVQ